MHIKVQKWGNSLAFRIPRAFAQKIELNLGSEAVLDIRGGNLIITPVKNEFSLARLLAGISRSNLHKEEDFGNQQGREQW